MGLSKAFIKFFSRVDVGVAEEECNIISSFLKPLDYSGRAGGATHMEKDPILLPHDQALYPAGVEIFEEGVENYINGGKGNRRTDHPCNSRVQDHF